MAVSIVTQVANTPASNVTVTPLVLPAGIQAGDMLHAFSVRPGSAASLTISGDVTGWTAAPEVSVSGFRGHYWFKTADGSESGDTVNINNPTSMKNTSIIVVTRGQASTAPIASGDPLATTVSVSATKTASSGIADENVAVLQCVMTTGPHNTVTGYSATGTTEVIESFRNTASTDTTGAAVYFKATPATSYGGNVFTQEVTATSSNNIMVWTVPLLLAPETIVTTYNPTSTVDNSGVWTNEGGAASIHAALADVSDATFAESPDSPSADPFTVGFATLDTGPITVAVRGSGTAVSRTIDLLEGSTVRATRTYTPAALDAPEDYIFTTTSGETAAITARTSIRVRITDTEV
jgi:hypothetical protein